MSVYLPPGKIKETLVVLPRMLIGVLGLILLTAACTTNPVNTAAKGASRNDLTAGKEKLECRYITGTGTNLTRKVCSSKVSWEAYDKKGREEAEEFTRRSRQKDGLTPPLTPSEQVSGRGSVPGPMQ